MKMLSHIIITSIFFIIKLQVSDAAWRYIPYGSCRFCYAVNLTRDVEFHLYTRENSCTPYHLEFKNENNLANSQFHPKHQTVIFIHGYEESASSESSKAIVNAYLERNMFNVILVNWEGLACAPWYNYAVTNSELVGPYVAQFVNWLESQNVIDMKDLHVIGFSLGAHVAGFMGKELAPKKVGRITGLDPAAPLIQDGNITSRLDKSDAIFVDVIHTSTDHGAPGLRDPIGHVDFYPNQGFKQPGCEIGNGGLNVCSHRRAWAFYVESILNANGFPASRCETLLESMTDNCTKDVETFMGFNVDKNTRGIFTLKTNSESPYSINSSEYINDGPSGKEGNTRSISKYINCRQRMLNKMKRRNKKKA